MGTHAHIEPGGYVTIDTAAWLERLTPDCQACMRHRGRLGVFD